VAEALPELALEGGRRVKLCRDHYRAYQRASRETRRLDRMGGTWYVNPDDGKPHQK
jgi:hypothetical protein